MDCNTIRLSDSPRGIRAATAILRQGGLVALPTETVYGLAADARNEAAVSAIYRAKGRPAINPLIVHVPDLAGAEALVQFNDQARSLANAFWPGPLTLVLPLRDDAGIAAPVTAGLSTLAVRVPDHPLAQALLQDSPLPLAAPSANISGKVSPTEADHVLDGLNGRIDAVLDGGPCPVGLESTIIGFDPGPTLLRPGGLPRDQIEALVGPLATPKGSAISAPGQLSSHYAPETRLILNSEADAPLWLAFGPLGKRKGISLSETSDLTEAATTLFRALREADALAKAHGHATINVDPIPETGLGAAINDRLRRAAAPVAQKR